MNELTNKVNKNTDLVVCTNSHCKKRGWSCATGFFMILTMFLFRPNDALDIFATWKCVIYDGKFRLDILANLIFYRPEMVIKLAKNKITKIKIT